MVLLTSPDADIYEVKPAETLHVSRGSKRRYLYPHVFCRRSSELPAYFFFVNMADCAIIPMTQRPLLLDLVMTIRMLFDLLPGHRRFGRGTGTFVGIWTPGAGTRCASATRASFLSSQSGRFKLDTTGKPLQLSCHVRASAPTWFVKVAPQDPVQLFPPRLHLSL